MGLSLTTDKNRRPNQGLGPKVWRRGRSRIARFVMLLFQGGATTVEDLIAGLDLLRAIYPASRIAVSAVSAAPSSSPPG